LFSSFAKKKCTDVNLSNHSSHPMPNDDHYPNATLPNQHNSEHNARLTEMIQANFGGATQSIADVTQMLRTNTLNGELMDEASTLSRPKAHLSRTSSMRSSISGEEFVAAESHGKSTHSFMSSTTSCGSYESNELDIKTNPLKDSVAMLQRLGDSPSSHELDKIAAVRAKEYIDECLPSKYREKWDSIPHFSKADLAVGKFLGKGTFSDVFEVLATVIVEETPTLESLGTDKDDLEKLLDAKFPRRGDCKEDSSHGGGVEEGDHSNHDDLDDEIDALFGSTSSKGPPQSEKEEDAERPNEEKARTKPMHTSEQFYSPRRRATSNLHGSVCLGSIGRPSEKKRQERKITLAMKCLRPNVRSSIEQFIIGVEDLVQESVMLASLDHPNIVKIHGRAGGCVSNSHRLSDDGYFILLDRLTDTLDDRILRWKRSYTARSPPSLSQIKAACSIADAMSYLHDKMIVFRDLKPANVGFNSRGVLKLFDFGFARCTAESDSSSMCIDKLDDGEVSHLLYDKCGTPRYMAPEVGLESGYSFPADVHSFGILLWQICALKKPFDKVESTDEFHEVVFVNGTRPKLVKYWPQVLRDTMTSCWSVSAADRPDMRYVKTMLSAYARDASMQQNKGKGNLLNSRSSFIIAARRFTG
jgi:serine/threonine protein kinase